MAVETKAPIFGKDKILYVRRLEDAATNAGARLALQIEHELSYENSTDAKQTKDGSITTQSGTVATMSISAVATRDEVNKILERAAINGETLEVWEIDLLDVDEEGKYGAKYMQGKLDSWTLPAPGEDTVDISTNLQIDYLPQEGRATLSDEDLATVQYAFKDIPAETPQI